MIDLYVLARERSHVVIDTFLQRWTRGAAEAAADYEFPQYAESPTHVFKQPSELIQMLLKHGDEPHAIYWTHSRGPVLSSMLFFSTDGALFAGLSVDGTSDEVLAAFQALALSVDAKFGYCTADEPPPETIEEFQATARRATRPKLVAGVWST